MWLTPVTFRNLQVSTLMMRDLRQMSSQDNLPCIIACDFFSRLIDTKML